MTLLKRAYRFLSVEERRKAWLLLGFSLVVALFEMISTLSVMPFLAVLADPGQVESNRYLAALLDLTGSRDTTSFLIFLGVGSFVMLVIAAGVRAMGQYVIFRFTNQRNASISRRLLDAYLRRPYSYFLSRNSSDLNRKLLEEANQVSTRIYLPLTSLFSQSVLVIGLLTVLVLIDPVVAFIGAGVLGLCYVLVFLMVRTAMTTLGKQRIQANKRRFRMASEALGGIKTVKISGNERAYLHRFSNAARTLAHLQARSQTLGSLPRYGIEVVAFGGIILLALLLLLQNRDDPNGGLGQLLPLLGVYAFTGYRLMPALQGIYGSLTQLRFGAPIFDSLSEDLSELESLPPLPATAATPMEFNREIDLDNISFSHAGAQQPTLQDITLTIPKGTSFGVVGTTGAGKTTLMDLFLGLLTASSGTFRIDDTELDADNLRAWQANLGYVPQDIYLLDASVAENIAFGVNPKNIDMDQVRRCADMAQLTDFVETQLPNGFQTETGERGVRMSGGQRQRIGIARALYRNPEVLVFDEATSALDTVTERAVVEAIDALSDTKTILIVAHRLSTVRECDQILVLDRGRIIGLGSYDQLLEANPAFRRLVGLNAA